MSALGWIVGTFHTTALASTLLLLLYPRGGVGIGLAGLNTVTGLAIFVALWATTVFTTGRALRGLDLLAEIAETDQIRRIRRTFVRRALRWGGANGVLFLALGGSIALVNAVVASTAPVSFGSVFVLVMIIGVFGGLVAFVSGALLGVAFAALDLFALWIARAIVRE